MDDWGSLVVAEIPFALMSSEQRWFPCAVHLGGAYPLRWVHLEGPEEGQDSRGARATYAVSPALSRARQGRLSPAAKEEAERRRELMKTTRAQPSYTRPPV